MSTKIKIPTPLRRHTNGLSTIEISASENVRGTLHTLTAQYPTISERLFDGQGQVKTHINIFLNNEDIRFLNGLETNVRDGDTVALLPALAGG
ncbi:MAG: molybdopterin synthase sulfur carrier subunit [Chloroflexi bacterium UTCFX4]|jgi:molybdopterin synthase sulfur carrier subunit|nr:MAG: molybdopterin synthase sulfur carrier subunit [Chloroflexi bacterium UTCFX4]